MAFKDVLIALDGYPEPVSEAAVWDAVAWARLLGAWPTALSFEVEMPGAGDVLATAVLHIDDLIVAEQRRSRANAAALLAAFAAAGGRSGPPGDTLVERGRAAHLPDLLVGHARVHDLTVLPVRPGDATQTRWPEAVLFGSGRPVLLLPDAARRKAPAFGLVAVGWDGGAPAARAVADALPILARAARVRVVTVAGEASHDTPRGPFAPASALLRHLARHGVQATAEEVDAAGRPAGDALHDDAARHGADLLVMGAYGHSRLRELVLGGATRTLLGRLPLPLFLSR